MRERERSLSDKKRASPSDLLRVISGRSNGSGETRATALPKPSAALFAQVLLATNCRARFSALGGRLALSMRGTFAAPSAFVVEFELWLSSGWVGSHRVE